MILSLHFFQRGRESIFDLNVNSERNVKLNVIRELSCFARIDF